MHICTEYIHSICMKKMGLACDKIGDMIYAFCFVVVVLVDVAVDMPKMFIQALYQCCKLNVMCTIYLYAVYSYTIFISRTLIPFHVLLLWPAY